MREANLDTDSRRAYTDSCYAIELVFVAYRLATPAVKLLFHIPYQKDSK